LTDPISGALRKPDELQEAFDKAGANNFDHLITYCGGGIAASTAFLALKLIGWDHIALYDGSLMEWNDDPVAPIEVGPLVND
jgi:thiosulfate/3-mercaptopyruvate sulfurtransferase